MVNSFDHIGRDHTILSDWTENILSALNSVELINIDPKTAQLTSFYVHDKGSFSLFYERKLSYKYV